MDCSRVLDCARHTPILGGILAASCRPFCPSSTAGAVSPLTVTDTRVRSVFLASSATLPVLSWKAPSIGFVMVGPVRFAWLRRCSSAASVHSLCPDHNDAISREFQRVPAPSAQLARLHLVTIATNHPQLDSLPPDPPPPAVSTGRVSAELPLLRGGATPPSGAGGPHISHRTVPHTGGPTYQAGLPFHTHQDKNHHPCG